MACRSVADGVRVAGHFTLETVGILGSQGPFAARDQLLVDDVALDLIDAFPNGHKGCFAEVAFGIELGVFVAVHTDR